MQADDLILISVDDHVVEPPTLFDRHLPAAYKDQAPRVVTLADGAEVWLFNGRPRPNIGLNAVVGRRPEEYGMEPTAYAQMRAGCYDVDARIGDMNANGVLASMCFPSFPTFAGQTFAECADKTLARALVQAYNDWHIDEWCGSHPGRFIPLALPMIWDPQLTAGEVRRVAKKGCHALSFTSDPVGLGYPSIHTGHWDPLWQACADEGTVVAVHIGSGPALQVSSMDSPVDVMIAATPITSYEYATDLLFSPVLRRFSGIRFALSEGGIGWIPYFLERADYVYAHHHAWTHQDFGGRLPSEVFRDHVLTCFIDDRAGVKARHDVGLDGIMWECDYPHSDSTWPRSPEVLWRSLAGLPEDEIAQITHTNAMRHFRFDPFAHRPKARCTVAALRAEAAGVDLTPMAGRGGKPPAADAARIVTSGDIARQLAEAFGKPMVARD